MNEFLAVDLGGTRCRIGLGSASRKSAGFAAEAVYQNRDFSGIEGIIEHFLAEHKTTVRYGCLAVAGVVENNRARLTNLYWHIDGASLEKRFSFARVLVINDLTALAAVIPTLSSEDVHQLKGGRPLAGEPIAVVAPGTGLGEGYLLPHARGVVIRGSEGGHASFGPADEEELRITGWLLRKFPAVSAEMLCSGPGLTLLYRYYTEEEDLQPLEQVAEKAKGKTDLASVIVEGACAEPPCPLCGRIISRYLAMLGGECGNLALKLYARGGVYLGGGVIERLWDKFSFEPFLQSFSAKGKMVDLLKKIPVYIIKKHHANLHGAYQYGIDNLPVT